MPNTDPSTNCPCGSGRNLAECCGPFLAGALAPTAETLMRSRYSAYVLNDYDHLERTLAPEIRGEFDRREAQESARGVEWLGLKILGATLGGADDEIGTVEFRATYRQRKNFSVLHERSEFRKEDARWLYVDGKINPDMKPRTVVKIGRNDPCSCGSGKKYKKCCGA